MIQKQYISIDIQINENELNSFIYNNIINECIDTQFNKILKNSCITDDTELWNDKHNVFCCLVLKGMIPYEFKLNVPGKYIVNYKNNTLKHEYKPKEKYNLKKEYDKQKNDYNIFYIDFYNLNVTFKRTTHFIYDCEKDINNSLLVWNNRYISYYKKSNDIYKYTIRFINENEEQYTDKTLFDAIEKKYPFQDILDKLKIKFIENFNNRAKNNIYNERVYCDAYKTP